MAGGFQHRQAFFGAIRANAAASARANPSIFLLKKRQCWINRAMARWYGLAAGVGVAIKPLERRPGGTGRGARLTLWPPGEGRRGWSLDVLERWARRPCYKMSKL